MYEKLYEYSDFFQEVGRWYSGDKWLKGMSVMWMGILQRWRNNFKEV